MDTVTGHQADETAEPDEAASKIPMPPFPGAVRYGYRSDTVKIWQNSLRARGYTALKVDGIFGRYTNDCVVDWQTRRARARNVDGICALNMWRDLTTNPNYYSDEEEEVDPDSLASSPPEQLQEGPITYLPADETESEAES